MATAAEKRGCVPWLPTHATDVAAVQLLVAQSASASTIVGVLLTRPKLMPASVTLTVAAEARLYGCADVSAGPVVEFEVVKRTSGFARRKTPSEDSRH